MKQYIARCYTIIKLYCYKADFLRRVTNIPTPFGDFKKHINVLLKQKMAVLVWWSSQQQITWISSSVTWRF